jgi:hypothetical protein
MDTVTIKHKVLEELDLLPEDTLHDLYRIIHYFRLGLLADHPTPVGSIETQGSITSDENEEAIEREQKAFVALHPHLLAQYPGEEIAIYQGQVVDHDIDGVALSSRIYKRFPNEFVWIAPVTANPIEEWRVYSPRFEPLAS